MDNNIQISELADNKTEIGETKKCGIKEEEKFVNYMINQ